ncbi:SulP family inorganic anion transporter [Bacteroidota bacterium]
MPQGITSQYATDIKAGLTVGVVLVPQAVAYAVLAGMPPVYGLYASLLPLIVYSLFGSSPHLAVGVNAVDMLLIAGGLTALATPGTGEYIGLVALLALVTGAIQVVMGLLRLGFIVNLLSRPVATGFISGAALIIALNQFGALFGVVIPQSSQVHILLFGLVRHIADVNPFTAVIGMTSIIVIVGMKRLRPGYPVGITAAVLATTATWFFGLDALGVAVVGQLPSGLPWPQIPQFSTQTVRSILPTAGLLVLFQFMTVVSLSRSFAGKGGYRVAPNRELTAIGAANIFGGLFQGIPVSGSFSRTSILYTFGQTTKLANALAAVVVALTLAFFTPLFRFLPEAVLAAIIIVSISKLVDWKEARYLLRVKRSDGLIAVLTFLSTVIFGVVYGIAVGVLASVFAIMYRISRPKLVTLGHVPGTRSYRDINRYSKAELTEGVVLLRLDASFSFANAEFVHDHVLRAAQQDEDIHSVVLDGSGINDLDMTAASVLVDMATTLRKRGTELYITGLKGAVRDTISGTVLGDKIGKDHLLMTPHRAMTQIQEHQATKDKIESDS